MLYILLPIYNEDRIIKTVISELRSYLKGKKYTLVAVDDGSTDATYSILRKIKSADLVIEHYQVNMNIGSVFATGIDRVLSQAKPDDILVIMESDQTSSVERIAGLTDPIKNGKAEVTIASRYVPGGNYGNFPLDRRLFSLGANYLMRRFFPIDNVRDYTIFFRGYSVRLLQHARTIYGKFGLIQSKGFVANAEILVKLSFLSDKIIEVPFVYDYGKKTGKSKINISRTINEYFVVIGYLRGIRKKLPARKIA